MKGTPPAVAEGRYRQDSVMMPVSSARTRTRTLQVEQLVEGEGAYMLPVEKMVEEGEIPLAFLPHN